MPVFNIHHITKYEYDRPVKESVNEIRIYPFASNEQEVLYHELNITDHPDVLIISDYWGNRAGMFNLMPAHRGTGDRKQADCPDPWSNLVPKMELMPDLMS